MAQPGRIELYFIPLSAKNGGAPEFQDPNVDTNSISAATKFVSLTCQMVDGFPRQAMNFSIPTMQELVSIEDTISMCIALVV